MLTTNQAVGAAQRILEAITSETQLAEAIKANDPRTFNIGTFARQNIVRTHCVGKEWKRIGRQVLAVHPEIAEEVKVATSDKIPGEVFRTLPYMNPMIVYADPPKLPAWDRPGGFMRLLGFLTFGTTNFAPDPVAKARDMGQIIDSHIVPTTDPEATRFGVVLVMEVLDSVGKVVDIEFSTITLYYEHTMTLKEIMDRILSSFSWWGDGDTETNTRRRRWMRDVLGTTIGTLFYLCSTTLEAEKVPTKATKNVGRGILRKPLSLYRVGWTTGAALTRYRASRTYSTSEMIGPGHQQDPQHRRAHFKMQPCGSGKKDRKLIFVSPYWTHRELLGAEGVNTARSVPRVKPAEVKESMDAVRGVTEMITN